MEAIRIPAGCHKITLSTLLISLTLLSHHDNSQQSLHVSADLQISEFIEQLLDSLSRGKNDERIAQMRECYEPVLELVKNGASEALESHQTLAEAGVVEGDTLQIAARPLKEKLLFCRYSKLSAKG